MAKLLILLPSLLLGRYFLVSGFFPIHDSSHVARLFLMQRTISYGQFPPIWADFVNHGFGYPLFHFYAPLAYYSALAWHIFVPGFLLPIKLSFITAIVVAGLGMHTLMKRWGRGVAFLSTIAYLLSPYFALNLYVRGALAELWSMALLPWLFWAWQQKLSTRKQRLITAIITTLFLLSHNLIPLITLPFFLIWILLYQRYKLKQVFITALITLGLSSFYLLPLLFERSFVQVADIARTTKYSLHYLEPWQLWNSTWGFGGSAPGVEDGMSFKLGKLHLVLAFITTLVFIFKFIKSKSHSKLNSLVIYASISALVASLFTTAYTSFIWDRLAVLQFVQFPWRFITLINFFLAILVGLSLSLIRFSWLKRLVIIFLIPTFLFFNLKYFKPQTHLDITDNTYIQNDFFANTLAQIVPEYLPRWMPEFPQQYASELPTEVTGPTTLILSRAYYPTWKIFLDGKQVSFTYSDEGLIKLQVPAGIHQLKLKQSHTTLEVISTVITFITIASLYLF